MKKDLMYYVHKNRKGAWSKIFRISAETGKDIVAVVRNYQFNPETWTKCVKEKEVK
ncbi:hypothetical protein L6278_03205 [Candidatus Parcubacteria bacterium]|nr:hypothetical protein [Candidatus Parcubacteria bacterium]